VRRVVYDVSCSTSPHGRLFPSPKSPQSFNAASTHYINLTNISRSLLGLTFEHLRVLFIILAVSSLLVSCSGARALLIIMDSAATAAPPRRLPPYEVNCKWWLKGYCFRGADCFFKHDKALCGADKPKAAEEAPDGSQPLSSHPHLSTI
jgi:hypothetical protein